MSLEDMLLDFGCKVVGPALRLSHGLKLAQEADLDAAVLDVNMPEGFSFGIAAILTERRVPFCFSTGYGAAGIDPEFSAAPVLQKPYSSETLAATLLQFLV
jgi:DNA-binding LytR/AlgR family response regulator